jgi:hypothetical protein
MLCTPRIRMDTPGTSCSTSESASGKLVVLRMVSNLVHVHAVTRCTSFVRLYRESHIWMIDSDAYYSGVLQEDTLHGKLRGGQFLVYNNSVVNAVTTIDLERTLYSEGCVLDFCLHGVFFNLCKRCARAGCPRSTNTGWRQCTKLQCSGMPLRSRKCWDASLCCRHFGLGAIWTTHLKSLWSVLSGTSGYIYSINCGSKVITCVNIKCVYCRGSDHRLPFRCPADHLIQVPLLAYHKVPYRTANFLDHPRIPENVRASHAAVSFTASRTTDGGNLWPGMTEQEIGTALDAVKNVSVLEIK